MLMIDHVPHEIIRQILHYVSPEDNLCNVHLVSKRFHHLADEPLLWKYYCIASFTYWHPEHQFWQKLAFPAADVGWKQLWLLRKKRNVRASRFLDGILASQVGRLDKFAELGHLGYDAKDFLLEQCRADYSAEDMLARRYYGGRALDSIHRSIAVHEWSRFQDSSLDVKGLDRALGAFDLFVLHDQYGDLDETLQKFDDLAAQFRHEHPEFDELSTRRKAVTLLRWIRTNNLVGMAEPERNYRNIRNCMIGQALLDPEHPSLPIISSAIYCCIAERLGMKAACCAFPSHVHAAVFAPPGRDLDEHPADRADGGIEKLFLDPYGCDDEVTVEDLRSRLVEFGWMSGGDVFLTASPTAVIVQRTAQNIKATYMEAQRRQGVDTVELQRLRSGDPELNLQAAVYAALWANLQITPTSSFHWDGNLENFLNMFANFFSEDAWILERYLVPLYDSFVSTSPNPGGQRIGWENAHEALEIARNIDRRQPVVQRRYTQDIHSGVPYRIGQVFRHKRYHYIGVINGWAPPGGFGSLPTPNIVSLEETMENVNLDNSDSDSSSPSVGRGSGTGRTRKQTYYTCLRTTVDRHVVAQDNIQIITDPILIPSSMFYLAGKFFKRFDRETCTFVSNVREFYPDD